MSKATRQLENGHAEISRYALVDAIFKPTGARGTWEAVRKLDDETWEWQRVSDDKIPVTCWSNKLVILRVLRRGFGG